VSDSVVTESFWERDFEGTFGCI